VDVVDYGQQAANPRHSKPPRYALTTSSYQGNPRTNRWRTPECQSHARALLAARRAAGASRAARFKTPPCLPRPPSPPRYLDSGLSQSTVKQGGRALPEHRHRGSPRAPSRGSPRAPSKLNGAHATVGVT
jgi:hypothetical protein